MAGPAALDAQAPQTTRDAGTLPSPLPRPIASGVAPATVGACGRALVRAGQRVCRDPITTRMAAQRPDPPHGSRGRAAPCSLQTLAHEIWPSRAPDWRRLCPCCPAGPSLADLTEPCATMRLLATPTPSFAADGTTSRVVPSDVFELQLSTPKNRRLRLSALHSSALLRFAL